MTSLAPLAVTCGEPAGIGPEISSKAWAHLKQGAPFFVIGDPAHFSFGPIQAITEPSQAVEVFPNALPVLAHEFEGPRVAGQAQPAHAKDVIAVIERAVSLARTGQATGVCTNPIHKKALKDGAGFAFPGHTEFLAHLGDDADVVMMLASDQLRVVPATIHIALKDVPYALTPEGLETCIRMTHRALRNDFGIADPVLAIAGLNPHAGEGGAMGDEDAELIAPVIERLTAEGLRLRGPLPADTMFHARARAQYDAAICMYHDQALIPIKTLDFDRGVNVTLGLPFVRTSPDHGTAFDIAGKGIAEPTSLIEAIKLAQTLAANKTDQ